MRALTRRSATALVVATGCALLFLAALVTMPQQHTVTEVVVNIYDPKGVSMSPALEKLSPVKARLQQLTGCECVDISKVWKSSSIWGNYKPVCCDKKAPMGIDGFLNKNIQNAKSKTLMLEKAIASAKVKLDKTVSVIVDAQTLKNGGAPGAQGPVGNKGPQGYVGSPGAQGKRGPPGVIGPRGVKGWRGQIGYRGDTGDIGPQGVKGWEGTPGAPGYVGPDGVRGATGEMGPPGGAGPAGFRGGVGGVGRPGSGGPMGSEGPKGGVVQMFGWKGATHCNTAVGYQMNYLDRHNVDCTNTMGKAFIAQFLLTTHGCSGNQMRYESTCITPAKWVECANEGGTCKCPLGVVRFGDKSRYAPAKDVSHSIACNVNSFGDPAPGIGKKCECSRGGDIGGNDCFTSYTSCQIYGNLEYMDREAIYCPPTQMLTQMKLTSYQCGGGYMRYQYSCCTPARGFGQCRDVVNSCSDIAGRRIEYLDRQNVACDEFEALQSLSFSGRGCGNAYWGRMQHYNYKCCMLN